MKYFLDRNQIARLASSTEVFRRGADYQSRGRVMKIRFDEEARRAKAVVDGTASIYNTYAEFEKDGTLTGYACECEAHSAWKGACKHVIALLLVLFEESRDNAVNAAITRASSNMLSIFEKKALLSIDSELSAENPDEQEKITLTPTMQFDAAGDVMLSFSIGRRRQYVVKSIYQLANDYRNGNVIDYGKEMLAELSPGAFTPESLPLMEFILSEVSAYEYAARLTYGNLHTFNPTAVARQIKLTKAGLDKFFDIFEGKSVLASSNYSPLEKDSVIFEKRNPEIYFHLEKTDEQCAKLTCENPKYLLLEGANGSYCLTREYLYKIDGELFEALAPIFTALKYTKSDHLIFAKKDMNKVLTFLLPKLKELGICGSSPAFEENVRQMELIKKVYLDVKERIVTCALLYKYGEIEFNPLDSKKTDEIRNIIDEYRFKQKLKSMGFELNLPERIYEMRREDVIFDFYYNGSGLAELQKSAEVYVTDAFMKQSVKQKTSPSFGLRIAGNLLELSIDVKFDIKELQNVIRSYQDNKKYHRLKDGRFVSFNEDGMEKAISLISGLSLTEKDLKNGKALIPKYRALYIDSITNEDLGDITFDKPVKKLIRDFRMYRDIEFKLPESLEPILRDYQREGFNWLKVLAHYGFGGILADDMGLGKTLQAIALLLSDKEESAKEGKPRLPSIVVAPTSLIYNWEKEISRFAQGLTTRIISGPASARKSAIAGQCEDVIITTYDMLKRDIEEYESLQFRYIIADEAQNIKNPSTQNAKAVKMLKGECMLALTGTPIENSLSELWSIFDYIMPGYLFSSSKFSKHYESPILKNNDSERAAELKKQISPFLLRRVKRDVLKELPDKIETTLYADMTPEQEKLYSAFFLQAKGELMDTVKSGKYKEKQIEILSQLMRLRQICCHPSCFLENYDGGSGKLDLTMETVQSYIESGHRLLIFSQFTKMLGIIREELTKSNISFFYLDGATPPRERLLLTERFNNGESEVFLISLKAGGAGLNLTGADVVLHFDQWWNPAVMEQAADRAHRFGQKNTVQVLNLVAKDSIEEKILLLQSRKKDLVDLVIDENASFINVMTEEEVLELFKN